MNCPTCGGPTATYCTKKEKDQVTRYRKCLKCNYHRFSTVEKLHKYEAPIVKQDPVKTKQKRISKSLTNICRLFMKGEVKC